MKSELRAVVDTNVLVSAALQPLSIPRQAVDLSTQIGCILFSESTFFELDDVLRRPKFDKYASEQRRLEFLVSLVNVAEIVPISEVISECRDPKDNKILELAASGRASDVISGDADLLVLHPFRGIDISRPEAFLRKWRS